MSEHALFVERPAGERRERSVVEIPHGAGVVVGRADECDLPLDDPQVSGRHALITSDGERLVVTDLGSANGTFVATGDEEIRLERGQAHPLAAGDVLRIGPYRLYGGASLGRDVLLSPSFLSGTLVDEGARAAQADDPTGERRALEVFLRCRDRPTRTQPWRPWIRELVAWTGASRGALLARRGERFLLRSSHGQRGPYCLSQRFLEETTRRGGAWILHPASGATESLATESLLAYSGQTRLAGLRFDDEGEPVAVAYLELPLDVEPPSLAALEVFARLAGPTLGDLERLEAERRRRQALERRLSAADADGAIEGASAATGPVGESPVFRACVEAVRRAAPTDATLLLRGPSGSGKDELARLAHEESPRAERPLVAINCASLPEDLVESELFGHERGAFTGAERERAGAFERADGGTLFLDEVGDLSLAAQASLLRTLESKEVVRVGGGTRKVDVRLIAATHRNLESRVRERLFRNDLYYRLRVIEIVLPALSERPEDVVPLAEHFLPLFRRPDGERVAGISHRAARALAGYPWPGNVRELRNVVERAVVLDRDGILDIDDLPVDLVGAPEGASPPGSGDDALDGLLARPWPEAKSRFVARYFREALERAGGNATRAAREAGVTRRLFSQKIREFDLRSSDE